MGKVGWSQQRGGDSSAAYSCSSWGTYLLVAGVHAADAGDVWVNVGPSGRRAVPTDVPWERRGEGCLPAGTSLWTHQLTHDSGLTDSCGISNIHCSVRCPSLPFFFFFFRFSSTCTKNVRMRVLQRVYNLGCTNKDWLIEELGSVFPELPSENRSLDRGGCSWSRGDGRTEKTHFKIGLKTCRHEVIWPYAVQGEALHKYGVAWNEVGFIFSYNLLKGKKIKWEEGRELLRDTFWDSQHFLRHWKFPACTAKQVVGWLETASAQFVPSSTKQPGKHRPSNGSWFINYVWCWPYRRPAETASSSGKLWRQWGWIPLRNVHITTVLHLRYCK